MFGLCKYKNIFGEPGTGMHKYRIANIAIVDVIGTMIAAWFIGDIINKNYWHVLAALFVLSIAVHRAFCVETNIDKLLFS